MKKLIITLTLLLGIVYLHAQTLEQKIYIDFGLSSGTTTSADVNSNYWNNAVEPGVTGNIINLVNSGNISSGLKFLVVKKFTANNAGGLTNPDPALLNDLAVGTATQDYFFCEGGTNVTSAFKIRNLNPERAYRFHIFGSRNGSGTDERIALYTFYGLTMTSGTLQTTGPNLGGEGINQNNSQVYTSGYIFPDNNGEIMVEVSRAAGSFAHINALKMEEFSGVERPDYTLDQKLYFDFGDVNRITVNPDNNGNYWNNITSGTPSTSFTLTNSANVSTSYGLEITKQFTLNDSSPGGLEAVNPELLDDFAVVTAVRDYIFTNGTGEIKIKNLNPDKGYKFYIFGSRTDANNRIASYKLSGLNSYSGTYQNSGSNIGGTGINQNNSSMFISDYVFPDNEGNIYLEVSLLAGSYAHLNCMKMEEYTMPVEKATSITLSGNNITLTGATSQITAEVLPANAVYPDIKWSVNNSTIARIDNTGKLYPKANGQVQVTAIIEYDEQNIITQTIDINISNQLNEFYFAGTASENGEGLDNAIPMKMVTDLEETITPIFEVYTSLNNTGTFNFYTSVNPADAVVYGAGQTNGSIAIDGEPITSSSTGTVRIEVNLMNNTYTITPVSLSLTGSATPGGWSDINSLSIAYQGDGVWAQRLTFNAGTSSDRARVVVLLDKSWNYQMKKIRGTENSLALQSHAEIYGYNVDDIYTNLNGGTFDVTIDLRNYVYTIDCTGTDEYKISVMGSSVANGQGATNMQGYAYMYGQLLQNRYSESIGMYDWNLSNISINGNNTTNLLDRWDADLLGDCSKYVIYGLSLGNEGIHENGQSSFNSYRDNMQLLIQKARNENKIPVIMNSYTRGDFTATDYDYIKQMNLLIHEWDLPSVNTLGAIDNGFGQWANGYQVAGDIYHPTTEGHAEFFYAMVPSLFDALEEGKALPTMVSGTSYRIEKKNHIEFVPENIVHPFTLSFDFSTSTPGTLATFDNVSGTGSIKINEAGGLVYESPVSGSNTYNTSVMTGTWNKVTLTHYYAQGRTILYVNNEKAGELNEKLTPGKFYLGNVSAPDVVDYRQLFFWRSGMNDEEISALNEGKMLKSSLEIYAPLDRNKVVLSDSLMNMAQSTNTLKFYPDNTTSEAIYTHNNMSIYPNPAINSLYVAGLKNNHIYSYIIYTVDGKVVKASTLNNQDKEINISQLASSMYILEITDLNLSEKKRMSFIKSND